jgi:hypothetical protein
MQLVKRPFCRCVGAYELNPVLVDHENVITRQHLESFVPLVCTRCHSEHHMPLVVNPILPIPEGTPKDVVRALLNLDKLAKKHPNFLVARWCEGLTHGDVGAPFVTVTFVCAKHPAFEVTFSWMEDAKAPTSKAKPMKPDSVSVETMPAMFAEAMDLLRQFGLAPTQRGSNWPVHWMYFDSSYKTMPGVHTFRAKLTWLAGK